MQGWEGRCGREVGAHALGKGTGRLEDPQVPLMLRFFNPVNGTAPAFGSDGEGSHPPGGEGGLLAALDVDRAELLHAAQASGRQVRIGQVCGFLTTTGAAGGREAWVAGQRGTSCGRVVLHRTLHAVLLKHLLVYKFVVLREAEGKEVGKGERRGGWAPILWTAACLCPGPGEKGSQPPGAQTGIQEG